MFEYLIFLFGFILFLYFATKNYLREGNEDERETQAERRPLQRGRLIMPIPFRLRAGTLHEADIHRALHWMPYYQQLTQQGKSRFCGRVRDFMLSKEFTGMQGMQVTFDMAVSVSAAAVQLTFGLERYHFSHFHTIRIFPEIFYSKVNRNFLKGGASENGIIFLSWKDFVEGYKNEHDTFNLGLHEFAHALKINTTQGSDFDSDFIGYFEELEKSSSPVIDSIRRGEHNFLRKYGGTNMHEFFAVCVEHFFEVPQLFREKLPEIYEHLCRLLNQDPTQGQRDYRLAPHETSIRIMERTMMHRLKNYRYAKWHWSLTILLCGIFLSPYFLLVLVPPLILTAGGTWALFFGLVVTGGFLQYRSIVGQQALGLTQFISYLLLGFGPVSLVLLLSLNMLFSWPGESVEVYRMTGVVKRVDDGFKVFLENDAYGDRNGLTIISAADKDKVRNGDYFKIHFKNGLFGIPFKSYYTFQQK